MVISRPDAWGRVAIVNLTTRSTRYDESCIISAGEHPFVYHDSVIAYRHAQLKDADILKSVLIRGTYEYHQPVSPSLLAVSNRVL